MCALDILIPQLSCPATFSNAYQHFTIEVMKNSKNIPANERMDEAANLWKALAADDREVYVQKVKKVSDWEDWVLLHSSCQFVIVE